MLCMNAKTKPGKSTMSRFNMAIPSELLVAIDDWRRQQPELYNRSEAIRQIVQRFLDQNTKAKKAPKK